MLGRNVDDHFSKTPTPHFPRSRFDMGTHKRLQTQGHGRLYPFFCRMVFPGDTWQMDCTTFVRGDTSFRVPLDDIYQDTYWFFVPLRIIDENFPKVLGEGEPEDYDDVSYGIPQFELDNSNLDSENPTTLNFLLPYLGYSQASATGYLNDTYLFDYDDEISIYSLAAYYKVYNDWFRDENVDSSIPYGDLYTSSLSTLISDSLWDNFQALKVNRFHDYFASAMIAPQKGPAVTIPLGLSAPVGVQNNSLSSNTFGSGETFATGPVAPGSFVPGYVEYQNQPVTNLPIVADLSKAAGTINELYLAMAIQSLYTKRATFGTRYIETIRGQWGLEVPDSFFLRPEYLGGSRVTLNNVPVLSTENSSQLGQMSGNSSTLANAGHWSKTFIEYGILLGLSCTRIKHSYTQGKRKELFSLKTHLDLYNPVFCNIGPQAIREDEIYNQGTTNPDKVFAYQEAWADLRSDTDSFAGLFGIFSANTEIKNKWHYGDYYASVPQFSSDWLKEDYKNVARTMTGQLIAGAGSTEYEGHQFMFGYYYHPVVTRIMSSRSQLPDLTGRL